MADGELPKQLDSGGRIAMTRWADRSAISALYASDDLRARCVLSKPRSYTVEPRAPPTTNRIPGPIPGAQTLVDKPISPTIKNVQDGLPMG